MGIIMTNKYFVAYKAWSKNPEHHKDIWGNVQITTSKPVDDLDVVRAMEADILKNNGDGFTKVLIINYIKI